jgi:hypothetical protein
VRPRTGNRFSASLEAGSAMTPPPPPRPISLTERHVQLTWPTTPATVAERRLDTVEWLTRRKSYRSHAVRDRIGQGLPAVVLSIVPMTDTHTALCYLTPTAPRTARCGESSSGPCSLGISVQDQLLPPSLSNPLRGHGGLGIRAH